MDNVQEVLRNSNYYLDQREIKGAKEAKEMRRSGKKLNAWQKFSEQIYTHVGDKIRKGCTDEQIKRYVKEKRASPECKAAFSGGRQDAVDDLDLDLNASPSGSSWE